MIQIPKVFSKNYLLLAGATVLTSLSYSQNNTLLQGEIKKSDGSLYANSKVYLQWAVPLTVVDSTTTDAMGVFQFSKFPYNIYTIGLNINGVDDAVADQLSINALNPQKRNQHFHIEDGSLICNEIYYPSIKAAMENRENVFMLGLSSLQHDKAEESLTLGTDGSRKLSPKIGELSNLEALEIKINSITALPAEIGKLKKLGQLNANLNKLSSLPAEIGELKNLFILDLGKNNFQQFPEVVTNCNALIILNMESNPITGLPPSIGNLKALKELNLASCGELMTLPAEIGNLTSLETLDISNCGKLKELPASIVNLKNLRVLDVTGTKISTREFQKAVPGCEVRK